MVLACMNIAIADACFVNSSIIVLFCLPLVDFNEVVSSKNSKLFPAVSATNDRALLMTGVSSYEVDCLMSDRDLSSFLLSIGAKVPALLRRESLETYFYSFGLVRSMTTS